MINHAPTPIDDGLADEMEKYRRRDAIYGVRCLGGWFDNFGNCGENPGRDKSRPYGNRQCIIVGTAIHGVRINIHFKITIYNELGQQVRILTHEYKRAGQHTIIWNGKNLAGNPVPSGMYFYRMDTPGYTEVRKMLVVR